MSVPDSPEDPQNPQEPKCLISLCKHKMKSKAGSPLPAIEGRAHRTHGHWSSAKLRLLLRVLGEWLKNKKSNNI